MTDRRQMLLWPRDDQPLDDDRGQPVGDDFIDDLDDESFPPGPNYLARFREPATEEDLDQMARLLEQAIVEVFGEPGEDR